MIQNTIVLGNIKMRDYIGRVSRIETRSCRLKGFACSRVPPASSGISGRAWRPLIVNLKGRLDRSKETLDQFTYS